MSTISMFYGIVIRMYKEQGGKHKMPHIHAEYADYEAVFDFDNNFLEDELTKNRENMQKHGYYCMRKSFMLANWKLLQDGEPFLKLSL